MKQQEPNFQFRGVWIPAGILKQLHGGSLNTLDVIFLAVVDGLTEHGGRGCWASNSYLAGLLACDIRTVQRTISKCIGLKILRKTENNGRRTLETVWSRIGEGGDRSVVSGDKYCAGGDTPVTGRSITNVIELDNKTDSTSQRLLGVSEMPSARFRPEQTQTKATEFDFEMADKLHELNMERRQKYGGRWQRTKEADAIRLLRKELKDGESRIARALEWYAENYRMKGVPSINTAGDLRKRWDWLEDVMVKDIGPQITVNMKKVKPILDVLRMKKWPKGADSVLPTAVAVSLANLKEIAGLARAHAEAEDQNTLTRNFLIQRFLPWLMPPDQFVINWFNNIHNNVANWAGWNGDLMSLVISLEAKRFQQLAKEEAQNYAGSQKPWKKFMESHQCR